MSINLHLFICEPQNFFGLSNTWREYGLRLSNIGFILPYTPANLWILTGKYSLWFQENSSNFALRAFLIRRRSTKYWTVYIRKWRYLYTIQKSEWKTAWIYTQHMRKAIRLLVYACQSQFIVSRKPSLILFSWETCLLSAYTEETLPNVRSFLPFLFDLL